MKTYQIQNIQLLGQTISQHYLLLDNRPRKFRNKILPPPPSSKTEHTSVVEEQSSVDVDHSENQDDVDFNNLSSEDLEMNKLDVLIAGVSSFSQLKYYSSTVFSCNE